jgi:hypothetical protein
LEREKTKNDEEEKKRRFGEENDKLERSNRETCT